MIRRTTFILVIGILVSTSSYSQIDKKLIKREIDSLTLIIDRCLNCGYEYFVRARKQRILGNDMEAMKDFGKSIEIGVEYPKITFRLAERYNERAYLKMDLKDFRGAIADFDAAVETQEGWASLWTEVFFGRAYSKTKLGDLEGAAEDYKKVLIHSHDDKVTYHNLGLITIQLGDKERGCKYLSKSGELGYSHAYEAIAQFCN